MTFSTFLTLLCGIFRPELCLLIFPHWSVVVFMWAGADTVGVNFSKWYWLSVCLFSDYKGDKPFLFEFEHVVWILTREAYFYLSHVWKKKKIFRMSPASVFIDMWKTHALVSVTFTAWTVCTLTNWQHLACKAGFWVDLPVKTLISFTPVVTHDSELRHTTGRQK